MPRFFVEQNQIQNIDGKPQTITIDNEDAAHISKSLRMRVGEKIVVCDGLSKEYDCTIQTVGTQVTLAVDSWKLSENEPPYRVVLYQALVKGDKFETVIQKAVECGVSEIVPVQTARVDVKPDEKSMEKRLVRYQKIAKEAAGQSGRALVPKVRPLMKMKEALEDASHNQLAFVCYENDEHLTLKRLLQKDRPQTIAFFVGPEGGFSQEEIALAGQYGVQSVGLGKRILRTETAGSFVLAALSLMYELD